MKSLYELRKRAGLTQAELGNRTGISRYRLVYAEGGYQLSPEEETKILEAIKCAIEENTANIRSIMADRAAPAVRA